MIVSVLSPVNVGLVNGALSAKVDARDVLPNVMAGVVSVPVKVGLARGA